MALGTGFTASVPSAFLLGRTALRLLFTQHSSWEGICSGNGLGLASISSWLKQRRGFGANRMEWANAMMRGQICGRSFPYPIFGPTLSLGSFPSIPRVGLWGTREDNLNFPCYSASGKCRVQNLFSGKTKEMECSKAIHKLGLSGRTGSWINENGKINGEAIRWAELGKV